MSEPLVTEVVKIEVDDRDLSRLGLDIEEVEADLKRFGAQKYKATVEADTKAARANVKELRLELQRLQEEEKKAAIEAKAAGAAQTDASKKSLAAKSAETAAAKQALADEQKRVISLERLGSEVTKVQKLEAAAAKERSANARQASKEADAAAKQAKTLADAAAKRDAKMRADIKATQAERTKAANAKAAADAASARADAVAARAAATRSRAEQAAADTNIRQSEDLVKAQEREATAEAKAAAQKEADLRKEAQMQMDAAKTESQAATKRQGDLRKEAQMQMDAAKMDAQIEADHAAASLRSAESDAKAAAAQSQYAAAQKRLADLQKLERRSQGSDKVRVQVDSVKAAAEMEMLRLKLTAMGEKPIDIHARVTTGDRLQRAFLGPQDVAFTQRVKAGLNDVVAAAKGGRVNILGMSMSVITLGTALATLAPIIVGLVGALGALVSVAGSGLAGAIGLGGAALSGFGMAAVGMFAMLKPAVTQFTNIRTAVKAHTTAVNKYGAGSKQAAQAQKTLNAVVAQASPQVRAATKDWQQASDQWHKLTDTTATRDFGRILGSTMKTAGSDMKFFATDSKGALNAVSAGWGKWMADLRSPQAKADLNNIFSNFNKTIPNVMSAFQHLGDAARRVFSVFSNFLPGMSHGFDSWAKSIDKASQNGPKMEAMAQRMVTSLQDVGHFAQAAGGFLVAFFKAGTGTGQSFLQDMTNGLDKVTASMNTVAGQNKLQGFFQRSVATTKNLWNALVPLVHTFTALGAALRPVSDLALTVVEAFAKLIAAAISFKPLQIVGGLALAAAVIGRMGSAVWSLGKGLVSVGKNAATFAMGISRLGVKGSFANAFGGAAGGASAGTTLGEAANTTMAEGAIANGTAFGEAASAAMTTGGAAGAAERAIVPAAETAVPAAAGGELAGLTAGTAGLTEVDASLAAGTVATGGFAAALGGLAIPLGVAALGLGAIVGAIALFGGGEDKTASIQEHLNKEMAAGAKILPALNVGFRNNTSTAVGLIGVHSELASSTKSLNSLSEKLNRLQAEGKTGTDAYKNALAAFNQQYQQHSQIQQQWIKGTNSQIKTDKQAAGVVSKDVNTALSNEADALSNLKDKQKAYNEAKGNPREALSALDALKSAQAVYNKSQNAAALATARQSRAEQDLITQHVNLARESKNLSPILTNMMGHFGSVTENAGAAVGGLLQRLGKAGQVKAVSFLVHLPNPAQIVQITKLIDGLRSEGDVKKSFSILGDSKNATDAIKAIQALSINEKKVSVTATTNDALAKLKQLTNLGIPDKHMKITGDDTDVKSKISLVNRMTLIAKTLALLGDPSGALNAHGQVSNLANIYKTLVISGDDSGAIQAVDAVQNAINSVSSGLAAMVGAAQRAGAAAASALTHHKAQGGPVYAQGGAVVAAARGISKNPILRDKQKRAAVAAATRPAGSSRMGGAYSKPTYLVGEEGRPEFVIATNPAYRKANVGYLADAAHQFGLNLTAAAMGTNAKKGKKHPKTGVPQPDKSGAYTDPRAASNPKVGSPGEKQQKKRDKPKHPTPPGLPAQDRIGGVGTADIDAAVAAAQQAYDTKKQNMTSARVQNSKNKSVPKYSAKQITDQTKGLKDKLDGLKAFDTKAKNDIQDFTNLESQISATQSYLTVADANPQDTAEGYNEKGRLITATWAVWDKQLNDLEAKHTSQLKAAVKDAKSRLGKNPDATNLGYVRTLEAALGTSIVDQQAAQQAVDTANTSAVTAPTLDDFITSLGNKPFGGQPLDQLQAAYAVAQTNNQEDNPGTPAREDITSQADDLTAAVNIQTFYSKVLDALEAQKPKNFPLITEAANDLTAAQQTVQGLNDTVTSASNASGPSNAQLASSALYSMFQQYGSNVSNAMLLSGPQAAATGFDPLEGSMGGLAAGNVMKPSAASVAGTQVTHHTDNSKTANVENHYASPPEDPHSWSKGLNWELENAL